MKIILLEDVERVGKAGDVTQVKDGFARNFLIPKGLAEAATPQGLKRASEIERKRLLKIKMIKEEAERRAEALSSFSCTTTVRAGHDDKLFGAVTSQDIADAFAAEGVHIDKKDILLEEPLKKLGVYQIPVKLHPEVSTRVKVWVVKE